MRAADDEVGTRQPPAAHPPAFTVTNCNCSAGQLDSQGLFMVKNLKEIETLRPVVSM